MQSSGFIRIFTGDHWRNVWTMPLTIPVLDLKNSAGGLTPTKKGGGLQTKSIHFIGKDGKKYKFRSFKKDVSRSLPPDFANSIIRDVMQDQVSVTNPGSSVIIPGLMEALGILHVKPVICFLPDSDLLGKFQNEFGGLAGTVEENPDNYNNTNLNFAKCDLVFETFKLIKRLEKNNDEQVDQVEFLKARLLDILIGDRDRHAGQWDWAGYISGNKINWKPIPKDRDFAFPLYDGLIPKSLTVAITSFVNFGKDMPSMLDITWEGRHLDRRFLGTLEKKKWDSVAVFIQNALTDSVIENSVKNLPPEYFNICGSRLISKIKSRRDQLKQASDEFYKLVVMYVDLYGSDRPEYLKVNRINDKFTEYSLFNVDEISGQIIFPPFKIGLLDNSITDELRVHLLDGGDKAIINGNVNDGIRVIVDGGKGKDMLVDSSVVKGNLLHLLPIKIPFKKTEFYDSGKKTMLYTGDATYFNNSKIEIPDDESLRYEPAQEDRYHDYGVLIPFEYNTDEGLFAGIGGRINYYDFRQAPFDHKFELAYGYAYKIEKHYLNFLGEFNDLIENTNVKIPFTYSGLEITKFYGFGNESKFEEDSLSHKYYDVSQRLASLGVHASVPVTKTIDLLFGVAYEYSNIVPKDSTLLQNLKPYGTNNLNLINTSVGIKFDSRDNVDIPESGSFVLARFHYYPRVFNADNDFASADIDLRHYISIKWITDIVLAGRLIGANVWGDYPFFKGASIGGKKSFRGFPHGRFIGDASIVGEFDIRTFIGRFNVLFPFDLGTNLFSDIGKVFLNGESSSEWHNSFGAGIWISVYQKKFNLSLNVARSPEITRLYITLGQMF